MIVIVKICNNRILICQDFIKKEDADKHVAKHGGFVYDGQYSRELYVVGSTVSVVPIPPTPEEIQAAKDAQDTAEAKSYAKLTALKNMTPAEIQAWVEANVTNLAQAQDAIATLAIGVGILARRM